MSKREILFRGKRAGNGEWVEGYFFRQYGSNEIITADNEIYHITPDTVGQYTGLKDKNGTRIFEGDILKIHFGKDALKAVAKFECYSQPDKILGTHKILGTYLGFYFDFVNASDYYDCFREDAGYWTGRTASEIEVIGNIHDNPTLLEDE